jgi:K+-transporting ATPase ATPase C chain
MWQKSIVPALRILLVLTFLTGVLYPLAVTAAALLVFPAQANGSLAQRNGAVIGSTLIGQMNDDARYFWPRPSAVNYMDGSSPSSLGISSGSNLGPTSATLSAQVAERAANFRAANSLSATAPIPSDMLTASGSGLDPQISPAAARAQVDRVAAARGMGSSAVAALVEQHIEQSQFGFLGEPRVNVLELNLALDQVE